MSFLSDCSCVSGIEHFLDPRMYLPQWDGKGDDFQLNIHDKKLREAEVEYVQKAAEENEKTNVEISPERVAEFVVQRNVLVPTGFTHFVAYQIESMYVRIKSLDTFWRNCNISLIFTHNESDNSVTVPVLALDSLVTIPASVLKPGTLKIAVMGVNPYGAYNVVTTEALEYRVYDAGITPISWPAMKDYDIYLNYQSLAKNLLNEVAALRKNESVYFDLADLKVFVKQEGSDKLELLEDTAKVNLEYNDNIVRLKPRNVLIENIKGTETELLINIDLPSISIDNLDTDYSWVSHITYTATNQSNPDDMYITALLPAVTEVVEEAQDTKTYYVKVTLPKNNTPPDLDFGPVTINYNRSLSVVIPELSLRRIND